TVENARVVCRQVGQPSTRCVAEFRSIQDIPEESKSIQHWNYHCLGNETAVHKCPYHFDKDIPLGSCGNLPRFAVICGSQCPTWRYGNDCLPCFCNQNNTEKCDSDTGKCTCKAGFSGETCDCLTGKHTCDSKTSICHLDNGKPICLCKKGVSATPRNKCKDFGLRFMDRSAVDKGEVEFYSNGTWNPLCLWYSNPSGNNVFSVLNVICRQLGLPVVHTGSYYSAFIHKTNLPDYEIAEASCDGTETSMKDCNITMAPAFKCNLAVKPVGIRCFG
ncbi:multiple epidermal growth factor-like domains protein 10, partial [Saccostrea cucullata]|uniref:multiple epidermal growth factor-like domains protein 10 n=1 Tax=Saccostrea cuccullata TaxID=36930 RepID=UPI002ED195FE